MEKEDYWKSLFGMKMFKSYQKIILRELQKEAYTGQKSPNPVLFSVDGSTTSKLLDWTRGDRPLVVNFGSYTCPVFMARLREFGEIVDKFSNVADFVTIYIEEAHPIDEWSLKVNTIMKYFYMASISYYYYKAFPPNRETKEKRERNLI